MAFIAREARRASMQLAEQRGVFPDWGMSIFAGKGLRLRNATQTSIAPTGTISIIAGTSSGIEPLFALAYRRSQVLGDQTLTEFNPLPVRHLERLGLASPQVLRSVASSGRLDAATGIPEDISKLFVTALEIPPEQHVRVQAAFQKYCDNAVSKTVNLPEEATPNDVADVYRLAYQLRCKGVTVFRYGSKSEMMLQLGLGETLEAREYFAKCDPGACRL
jgi:ribonucleoside-diphosphate reductase alpha chain